MKLTRLLVMISIFSLLATTITIAPTPTMAQTPNKWLLCIYMNADNNLDPFSDRDMAEISITSPDFTIIVLADYNIGSASYSSDRSAKIYKITQTSTIAYNPSEFGIDSEPNMGNPNTLSTFINNAIRNYGQDSYTMLDLWNHGSSFMNSMEDYQNGDSLSPADLNIALQNFEYHLDIIGFDACYMADLAVAYQISPFADYFIASEDFEPGDGWDYTFTKDITGTTTPEQFGTKIVDYFGVEYGYVYTLSMIDLTRLNIYTVPKFNTALLAMGGMTQQQINDAWPQAKKYGTNYFKYIADLRSLLDKCKAESTNADIQTAIQGAIDELDTAVIRKTKDGGLTIYFPPAGEKINQLYRSYYALGTDTIYTEWLDAYHNNNLQATPALLPQTPQVKVIQPGVLECTLPGIEVGRVEAKIDGGQWFYGRQEITTDPHILSTRYNDGENIGEVNITGIENITTIITDVVKETFQIQLKAGVNLITFQADPNMTADQFLQLAQAESLTYRQQESKYTSYIKDLKNIGNNIQLEPGVGYIVKTSTDYIYTYDGFPESITLNLEKGWNLMGIVTSQKASQIARTLTGTNIIVQHTDEGYRTYHEELQVTDFTINEGESVYIYAAQQEVVIL